MCLTIMTSLDVTIFIKNFFYKKFMIVLKEILDTKLLTKQTVYVWFYEELITDWFAGTMQKFQT